MSLLTSLQSTSWELLECSSHFFFRTVSNEAWNFFCKLPICLEDIDMRGNGFVVTKGFEDRR